MALHVVHQPDSAIPYEIFRTIHTLSFNDADRWQKEWMAFLIEGPTNDSWELKLTRNGISHRRCLYRTSGQHTVECVFASLLELREQWSDHW